MTNVLEAAETLEDLEALQREVCARIAEKKGGSAHLLNTIISEANLKNDAALGRLLGLSAQTLSSVRHGRKSVTAPMILTIHEKTGMSVAQIKSLIKDQA